MQTGPQQGGDRPRSVAARAHDPARVPSVLLYIVVLYVLVFTHIVSGSVLSQGALDPSIYEDAAKSNAINQLFWISLFVVSVTVAVMRRTRVLPHILPLFPLVAYLAWSLAMMPWAADRHVALRRLILQFCIVGSVWLPIVMIADSDRVRRLVFYAFLFIVLINVAMAAIIPPTTLGYAGLFSQKNELGAAAAMAFLTFLSGVGAKQRWERTASVLGIVPAAALLIASRSKTSMILAVAIPVLVAGVIMLSRAFRIRPVYLFWGGGAPVASAVVTTLGFGLRYDRVLHLLFGGATFTGRTAIWQFAWSQFQTRPITGFGSNGFWGVGANSAATFSSNAFLSNILQAHEGYLDVLLETGVVGLGLFIAFVSATLRNCASVIDKRGAFFFLAIAFFFILHNFFESSAFRRFEPNWVLFLIVAVAVARPRYARQPELDISAEWRPAC